MNADRLRQYAAEIQHPTGEIEHLSDYELGYVNGIIKAAELLTAWEREGGDEGHPS